MPYLKTFSCHSRSLRKVRGRLENTELENVLCKDFINLCERDAVGYTWDEQMDEMREVSGNNSKTYRGRQTRTYMHYAIYPDQRDKVTITQLRELTMEWAERYFADYQVVIIYHGANESCGIHAHVIVNNTNLEDGHRLSSDLTNKRVRQMNISLQEMALERGMSGFSVDHVSLTKEEMRDQRKSVSELHDDDDWGENRCLS